MSTTRVYLGNDGANVCTVHVVKSEEEVASFVEETILQHERQEKESSIAFYDAGNVVHKFKQWKKLFPRVKPFYAVKCNNDYALLKTLFDLGASFDCASRNEIDQVISMGAKPSRIIFANPVKHRGHINYAMKNQVDLMTFDNIHELVKIHEIFPKARLVLRLLPLCEVKAQCELGIKFGCHPDRAVELLQKAKELELNVMGISFHVGSGIQGAEAFQFAIRQASMVFQKAQDMGFHMELLDIGGGFPGSKQDNIKIEKIAKVVNDALDKYFPADSKVRIIAEPGRYFAASAFTIYCRITGMRQVKLGARPADPREEVFMTPNDQPAYDYYLNDGVYCSFNCVLYDHAVVKCKPYREVGEDVPRYSSRLWGPTCDGLDLVMDNAELPLLQEGDWLEFPNMGAYTLSAGSTFNGFTPPQRLYYCLEDIWCVSGLAEHYSHQHYITVHPQAVSVNTQKLQLRAGHKAADMVEEDSLLTLVTEELALAD